MQNILIIHWLLFSLKKVQNKKAILKAIRDAELKAAGIAGNRAPNT